MTITDQAAGTAHLLAEQLVEFLETGTCPPRLFAPDLFTDFTMPTWRLQANTADASIAMRLGGHPTPGRVPRSRFDLTESGFVLEVEETWHQGNDSWYCRELFRADIRDGSISELAVYCTGDWNAARVAEHRASVALIRP